ncbi:acetolactate synthase 2 small subunit [Enterobacteriaceae endosymbiont of Macroplea appendiculata]|uniref:acetolactate synthase 2 small subunit n=1 Tax=Enterobacteriaceae endosymbiont of Macroplea appendiculata TaxID=2675790 RepID=UPI001449F923|nr:acetolactate synthase 2 small subunit [Enterobacteriaceae endosymbiont of Macroplea appendiculata]QJC30805.1 acetolactate synthase 2 small subunit [Enterobacteriaceae endosymbiont of Macroplea appendiculata]
MKKYQLYIITNIIPEITERIIRIIRHRGYLLYSINMNTIKKDNHIIFYIIVKSYKSIHLLVQQIYKLIDVKNIRIQ